MINSILIRRAAMSGLAALAAFGLGGPAFAQKTKLTVYTALENDQLDPFKKAFEADNPTIEIAWVRDSTGVDDGQADRREGQSARRHDLGPRRLEYGAVRAAMGMLEPYTPAGAAALKPMFKSGKNPETWVGMDAYLSWSASTPPKARRATSRCRRAGPT